MSFNKGGKCILCCASAVDGVWGAKGRLGDTLEHSEGKTVRDFLDEYSLLPEGVGTAGSLVCSMCFSLVKKGDLQAYELRRTVDALRNLMDGGYSEEADLQSVEEGVAARLASSLSPVVLREDVCFRNAPEGERMEQETTGKGLASRRSRRTRAGGNEPREWRKPAGQIVVGPKKVVKFESPEESTVGGDFPGDAESDGGAPWDPLSAAGGVSTNAEVVYTLARPGVAAKKKREKEGQDSKRKLKEVTEDQGETDGQPSEEGVYPCKYCDRKFMNKTGRTKHVGYSHPEEFKREPGGIICDCCGKTFRTKGAWKVHRGIVKKFDGGGVCDICGAYSASVKTHKKMTHGKSLKCDLCGEVFDTFYKRRTHLWKVHNVGQRPNRTVYKCGGCSFSTENRQKLVRHEVTKHGVKPAENDVFPCHLCSKVFYAQPRLKDHLNGHMGINPFECPLCSYASHTDGNLRIHVKQVHKMTLAGLKANSRIQEVSKRKSEETVAVKSEQGGEGSSDWMALFMEETVDAD